MTRSLLKVEECTHLTNFLTCLGVWDHCLVVKTNGSLQSGLMEAQIGAKSEISTIIRANLMLMAAEAIQLGETKEQHAAGTLFTKKMFEPFIHHHFDKNSFYGVKINEKIYLMK